MHIASRTSARCDAIIESVQARGAMKVPGRFQAHAVNAYARLADEDHLDTITSIDIVDINAGGHGRWFASNFDPGINFCEFTGTVQSVEGLDPQTFPDLLNRIGLPTRISDAAGDRTLTFRR